MSVKLAMAKSSLSVSDFPSMYAMLLDNYVHKAINQSDASTIADDLRTDSVKNLLNVSFISHYVKNKLNRLSTEDEVNLMKYFPNSKFLHNFYNMADHKLVSKFRFLILTPIAQNQKIFFRHDDFDKFLESKNNFGFKWKTVKPGFTLDSLTESNPFEKVSFKPDKEAEFYIRFMSYFKIPLKGVIKKTAFLNKNQLNKLKNVIFHIHGGGFICMSSSSHQSYLRKFSKGCDACLFSVDYPLAPLSKYKQTIQIVFKSYVYVLVR